MNKFLEIEGQNPPGYQEVYSEFLAMKKDPRFSDTTYQQMISDIKKMAQGELTDSKIRTEVYPEWKNEDFQYLLEDLNEK